MRGSDADALARSLNTAPTNTAAPHRKAVYGQYNLPGSTNRREVVVTLQRPAEDTTAAIRDEINALSRLPRSLTEAEQQRMDALRRELAAADEADAAKQQPYRSRHWPGIDNPLVHLRLSDLTDEDGDWVLVVEEIDRPRRSDGAGDECSGAARRAGHSRVEQGRRHLLRAAPVGEEGRPVG